MPSPTHRDGVVVAEKSHLKPQKCKFCDNAATKSILWAEGNAYIPTCDADFGKAKTKVTDPFTNETDPDGIDAVYDLKTQKRIDLAATNVSDDSCMVAFMIPQDIAKGLAVEGGEAPENLHVTLTFHPGCDEEQYQSLVADLRAWAADIPTPTTYEGQIGGIGAFPAGDDGVPWWVPVDIPGLNTLHEQVKAVADRSAPAADNHGYSPHMTLTYLPEGEAGPAPVAPVKVKFESIWVVRGNSQREEVRLTSQSSGTSAGDTEGATMASETELAEAPLSVMDLAERAKAIADPEARREAFARILDLAAGVPNHKISRPDPGKGKTKQGLPSYKKQGKWKHGFVPVDSKAVESKAKGSAVATKRVNRAFGKNAPVPANKPIKVETAGGNTTTAKTASRLAAPKIKDVKRSNRVRNSQFEENKVGRVDARATRAWDDIPAEAKTVRNGKRYVVTKFGGKDILTEWHGGIREGETKNTTRYVTLTSADAAKMSSAELRKILKDPASAKAVKRTAYKALQAQLKEQVKRA